MDMEKDLVHDSRGCGCGQANAGMDKRICEVGSVGAFWWALLSMVRSFFSTIFFVLQVQPICTGSRYALGEIRKGQTTNENRN